MAGWACRNASGRSAINWPTARRKRTAKKAIRMAARMLAKVPTSAARLTPSAVTTRGSVLASPSAASAPVTKSSHGECLSRSRTAFERCAEWNSAKITWHVADIIAPATIAYATITPPMLAGVRP
ncbi:hypothetical protein D3C87_1459840 [compost metagenome]